MMLVWQEAPGARWALPQLPVIGFEKLASPDSVGVPEITSSASPVLVSVTGLFCDLPMPAAKDTAAPGLAIGTVPLPVSCTEAGMSAGIESVPVASPAALGLKPAVTLHESPGATGVPEQPSLLGPVNPVPVTLMVPLMWRSALPVLVTVKSLVSAGVPTL